MKFNELNLSNELLRAIEECGFTDATYIQEKCLPIIQEGYDVIGQSQTGTGKTAAFGLPLLEKVVPNKSKKPQALILCPTRELCIQVCQEMRRFSKYIEGIRIVPIYGGQPITHQIRDLKGGVEIIVGTPGRVIDHMERKTLRFNELTTLVLDEADEMLNMGFRDDIERILEELPEEKQTILFSATMPKPILEITKEYQKEPVIIKTKTTQATAKDITQICYEVNQSSKKDLQIQLLELYNPELSMIFCNTKKMVDDLTAELVSLGYQAACIHGDMKQEMRSVVMERFKSKKIHILVATDIAARGIDVDSMDVVFNFDIPQELEYYIHRIGRTGRAGKSGIAITFATPRQRNYLKQIERITKSPIEQRDLPKLSDLKNLRLATVKKEIENGFEANIDSESYELIETLKAEGHTAEFLLATLIQKMVGRNTFSEIEAPTSKRKLEVTHKNMTKLKINVGRNQGVSAAHVVSAIAEATGLDGKDIGKIRIQERFITVEVPTQFEEKVIEDLNKTTIKGLHINVEVDNFTPGSSRRDRGGRSDRGRDRGRSDRNRSERGPRAPKKDDFFANKDAKNRRSTRSSDLKQKSDRSFNSKPRRGSRD